MFHPASRGAFGRGLPPLLLLVTAVISTACSSGRKPPPPLEAPAVFPAVSYRAGGPITSSTTHTATATAAGEALELRTTWIALSQAPEGFRPIQADATLIAAPRSSSPFLAVGQLSRGTQVVSGAKIDGFISGIERGLFGPEATIATQGAALPHGVTATFTLGDAARRIEIDLHRPLAPAGASTTRATTTAATAKDLIELSVVLDNVDGQRERLLLMPESMPPPAQVALIFPATFPASPRVKAVVALIELARPSDPEAHGERVAECMAQLRQAAADRDAAAFPADPSAAGGRAGVAALMRSMGQPQNARVAMVYLAGQTGAELLGDVALVAPEPVLADLSTRIQARLDELSSRIDTAQLGWMLDVMALEHLAALQSAETLPPELAGALARFAGEAARNAGSLDELARVRGREQLRARLIAENFTYLEDASPSARVRAYDWLQARGLAPEKYDPLGSAKARSAAIDAALTAAADAAAPTTQAVGTTGGAR